MDPALPVLEIRTYRLVRGGGTELQRIFEQSVAPMLDRWGIHVVSYGPSLDDDDHYHLIRSFSDADERTRQLDAFYGSEEWRSSHRERVLALIEDYHVVLVELTPALLERLSSSSADE